MDWKRRLEAEKKKIPGDYNNRQIKTFEKTDKIVQTKEQISEFLKNIFLRTDVYYRYENVVPMFGYGIPKVENLFNMVTKITELGISNIFSVGCGNAFFEMLLICLIPSLNIKATDIIPPKDYLYLPISNIDDKYMIKNIKKDLFKDIKVLLFVWPDPDKWVSKLIEIYRKNNKLEYLILVGEIFDGGSCMTHELYLELENWEIVYEDYYDSFQGLNEYIKIYKL